MRRGIAGHNLYSWDPAKASKLQHFIAIIVSCLPGKSDVQDRSQASCWPFTWLNDVQTSTGCLLRIEQYMSNL